MVDRSARDIIVARLVKFRDGLITGYDVLHRTSQSDLSAGDLLLVQDEGVRQVVLKLEIDLEDLHERTMPAEMTGYLNRIILFLKSDAEYRWRDSFWQWFGACWKGKRHEAGDRHAWPFFTSLDLQDALKELRVEETN